MLRPPWKNLRVAFVNLGVLATPPQKEPCKTMPLAKIPIKCSENILSMLKGAESVEVIGIKVVQAVRCCGRDALRGSGAVE